MCVFIMLSFSIVLQERQLNSFVYPPTQQPTLRTYNIAAGTSSRQNGIMLGCFSTISIPSLGEMEQTVCMLERGTIITKYYPRRKPEQKTLMLRRETRQVNIYILL